MGQLDGAPNGRRAAQTPRPRIGGKVRNRSADRRISGRHARRDRCTRRRRNDELGPLQIMIDREQLSVRQAVAQLGGTTTVRSPTGCLSSRSEVRTRARAAERSASDPPALLFQR